MAARRELEAEFKLAGRPRNPAAHRVRKRRYQQLGVSRPQHGPDDSLRLGSLLRDLQRAAANRRLARQKWNQRPSPRRARTRGAAAEARIRVLTGLRTSSSAAPRRTARPAEIPPPDGRSRTGPSPENGD